MVKFYRKFIGIIFATILLGAMCFFPIWKIQVRSELFNHTEFYSVIQLLFTGFESSKFVDGVRFVFTVSPIYILLFLATAVVGYKFLCSDRRFYIGMILMCIDIFSILVFYAISGNIESQELFSVGYSGYTGINFYCFIPFVLLITLCLSANYLIKKGSQKNQVNHYTDGNCDVKISCNSLK